MTSRRVTILGTSSQVPTRDRMQNGYAVQWDELLLLFDPGEGFHRQSLLAKVSIARADALFITHFHGDHCLGLPGVIHRRMLESDQAPLPIYYPSAGEETYQRLTHASVGSSHEALEARPVFGAGPVAGIGELAVSAARLEHPAPTYGYRLVEPDSARLDPVKVAAAGLSGPTLGKLQREGVIETQEGPRTLESLQRPRPGQSLAFVMDTALCEAAFELANGVDVLICEATFLESERALATEAGHMTARDAALLATRSGARRLILSHFSARYDDTSGFAQEAGELHGDVVVASDLARIRFPRRVP